MSNYSRKFFGYAAGIGLIVTSPKVSNYLFNAYTALGGTTDLPYLDHTQAVTAMKWGLEALIIYMGIKVIKDA